MTPESWTINFQHSFRPTDLEAYSVTLYAIERYMMEKPQLESHWGANVYAEIFFTMDIRLL
jgi:hypothetical protein